MIKKYFKLGGMGRNSKKQEDTPVGKLSDAARWRYIGNYPDSIEAIQSNKCINVEDYHQRIGKKRGFVLCNPEKLLIDSIDTRWVNKKYNLAPLGSDASDVIKAYLLGVKENQYSPNEGFNEEAYLETYPDVDAAVKSGGFLCGFEHYLLLGSKEQRAVQNVLEGEKSESYKKMMELEKRIPGVTSPVGLGRIDSIKNSYYKSYSSEWRMGSEKRLVALIPHLDPDILFGGYRAFFEFVKVVQGRGIKTHFIVVEPTAYQNTYAMLADLKDKSPDIYEVVTKYAPPTMCSMGGGAEIGVGDTLIAYSSSTARVATHLVKTNGLKPFLFFIQEFEPVFHASNSNYFMSGEPFYSENYIPIFNSEFLRRYFVNNNIGNSVVLSGGGFVFEHAIKKSSIDRQNIIGRKSKNFIFYARPESHAERNLFEVCVCAIEAAIYKGIFQSEWSFTGIGTLGSYANIDLPRGRIMKIIPKLPGDDYYRELQSYDAGMSLILTPHPGVVHYEFARAGIPTVTNTYFNRTALDLRGISRNIVPALPTIDSLVDALAEVARMALDTDTRIENANKMNCPSNWTDAYSSVADSVVALVNE